jgi:hypothetical protein
MTDTDVTLLPNYDNTASCGFGWRIHCGVEATQGALLRRQLHLPAVPAFDDDPSAHWLQKLHRLFVPRGFLRTHWRPLLALLLGNISYIHERHWLIRCVHALPAPGAVVTQGERLRRQLYPPTVPGFVPRAHWLQK